MAAEDWFDPYEGFWVGTAPRPHSLTQAERNVYAFDRIGNRIYPGDYVKCEVAGYQNFDKGERRRVINVSMDTLIMRNSASPTGSSAYQPRNFTLAGRRHAWHKSKEAKTMTRTNKIYLALMIDEARDYNRLADDIRHHRHIPFDADTSFSALKFRVEEMIRNDPNKRFLICGGTTIAEISAPPVRWFDA